MAEYRYYLIPDAMTRAFPEKFEKQTPTEFFDNIADLEKRYHQLREMPYNNERTWNERARFPYARLVVGVDRQNPDGAVAIIQVRNGVNYLCDDYRGPYADGSDAQIPQMAKKLVEVIGVDRVRPHTYTQRDGYTWVQVEKDMHITEWLYAHELCSSLQFTRFLNRDGRELFQVRDGQRVIETNADGTKRIRAVKSIDVTHAYVGHYGCHIQQYAEDNFRIGCYVAPEHPQPGDNLDKLQIYQVTKGGCKYRFMNYAYSKSRIHAADYSSVYIANLPADYDLDRCFQEFNAPNRPLRYHMESIPSLRQGAYKPDFTREKIAKLSYTVAEAAKAGDIDALRILDEASVCLADLAAAVARRVGNDELPVSLLGGTSHMGDIFTKRFEAALKEKLPQCSYRKPMFEPIVGAALFVMYEIVGRMDSREDFLKNIQAEWGTTYVNG